MKLLLVLAVITLMGCVSNAADTATPAPTNLTGIYKGSILGGSVTWQIFSDGTGIACEERTSVGAPAKLRDMVINGNKAFDVFVFTIGDVSSNGFKAYGITDMDFKAIKSMPVACKI